jgi:hypothetical protein
MGLQHLAESAFQDDPALIHDGNAVTQGLGLLHIMRREDERAPLGLDALNDLPHVLSSLRIKARRGLVQEHEDRIIDERHGQK